MKINDFITTPTLVDGQDTIMFLEASFDTDFEASVEWLDNGSPRIYKNSPKWANGSYRFLLRGFGYNVEKHIQKLLNYLTDCTIESETTDKQRFPFLFRGLLESYDVEYKGKNTAILTANLKGYKYSAHKTDMRTPVNNVCTFTFNNIGSLSGGMIITVGLSIANNENGNVIPIEVTEEGGTVHHMLHWDFPAGYLPQDYMTLVLDTIHGETYWTGRDTSVHHDCMQYLRELKMPKTNPKGDHLKFSIWSSVYNGSGARRDGSFDSCMVEVESRWI